MLANAESEPDGDESKKFIADLHAKMGTDPKKDGIAGLKAAMEDKLKDSDAMEKVRSTRAEMEKGSKKHYEARNDAEKRMANERQARSKAVIDYLVLKGKVGIADAPSALVQLANSGDKFEEIANGFGHSGKKAHSANLANAHAGVVKDERSRTAKLQELLDAREKQFPNETYDARFAAVSNSPDGQQLFAQMKRAGTLEE
jgi:hypothetical protein